MKTKGRRMLSLVMALVLMLGSLAPVSVCAEELPTIWSINTVQKELPTTGGELEVTINGEALRETVYCQLERQRMDRTGFEQVEPVKEIPVLMKKGKPYIKVKLPINTKDEKEVYRIGVNPEKPGGMYWGMETKTTIVVVNGKVDGEEKKIDRTKLTIHLKDQDGNPVSGVKLTEVDANYPLTETGPFEVKNGVFTYMLRDSMQEGGEICLYSSQKGKFELKPEKIFFTCKNNEFLTVNGKSFDGKPLSMKVIEKVEKPKENVSVLKSVEYYGQNMMTADGGETEFFVIGQNLDDKLRVSILKNGIPTDLQAEVIFKNPFVYRYVVVLPKNTEEEPVNYTIHASVSNQLSFKEGKIKVPPRKKESVPKPGDTVANVKTVAVMPEKVKSYGGEVTLAITGENLTKNNWDVEINTLLKGTDIELTEQKAVLSNKTEKGGILEFPANTMQNTVEYRIKVGGLKDGKVVPQAEVKVEQEKRPRMVDICPDRAEMLDEQTLLVTFPQEIKISNLPENRLKKMFYIGNFNNPNLNRIDLTNNGVVEVSGNKLKLIFPKPIVDQMNLLSTFYMDGGAIQTAGGIGVGSVKWMVTYKPKIYKSYAEKDIYDYHGGEVRVHLKGTRLSQINSNQIGVYFYRGDQAKAVGLPYNIKMGREPLITFNVPENNTDRTQTYVLSYSFNGNPVYEDSDATVISVLPKGVSNKKQTLSGLQISGNNPIEYAKDGSSITVQVKKTAGELKVCLKLYGTNLDSSKTEVRAIDEDGVIWPVYHCPV